jgi:hypothetical protein
VARIIAPAPSLSKRSADAAEVRRGRAFRSSVVRAFLDERSTNLWSLLGRNLQRSRNIPTAEPSPQGCQTRRQVVPKVENVALSASQAVKLARALRELRESTWPDQELTHAQLAKALSSEGRVAGATLSSSHQLGGPARRFARRPLQ